MSIILNATPLSKMEWKLSNLITAQSLFEIANFGGPRCCKRDTYVALETAIEFTNQNLEIKLDSSEIKCGYYKRNKECIMKNCKYFPQNVVSNI